MMDSLSSDLQANSNASVWQHGVRLWLLVGSAAACLAIGVAAIVTALGGLILPDALAVLEQRLPVLFRIHMMTGGLGLLLLPLALASRAVALRFHKPIGRAALTSLLIASMTGMASAAASVATPLARAGFAAQGLSTIVLLLAALHAVRSGQARRHALLMQAAAAIISGVIVLRLGTWATAGSGVDFDRAYGLLAWGSWLLPLLIVIAWQTRCRLAWHLRRMTGRPISSSN